MITRISSIYEILGQHAPKVVAVVSEHLDRKEIWEEDEKKWVKSYRPREQVLLNWLLEAGIQAVSETESALDDSTSRLFDPSIEMCFAVGEEFNRCSGIAMRIGKSIPRLSGSTYVEICWPLDSEPARNRVVMALQRVAGIHLIHRMVVLTRTVPPPRNPEFSGLEVPGLLKAPSETPKRKENPKNPQKPKQRVSVPPPSPPRDPALVRSMIPVFAPPWAEFFGEDDFGIFAEFRLQEVPFVWRWIPPGTFLMGSGKRAAYGFGDEQPQHEVTISAGFWLGETPVTQAQWRVMTDEQPAHFRKSEHPVESVNWAEARAYAHQLTQAIPGLRATLPTEAQWEYACRADTRGDFYDGSICTQPTGHDSALDRLGWYLANSRRQTQKVKQLVPNSWGLFDLLGNVWEWCLDGKRRYNKFSQLDPGSTLDTSPIRVVRGGGWDSWAQCCRTAYRSAIAPDSRRYDVGFRLAAGPESGSPEPMDGERRAVRPEGQGRKAELRDEIAIAAVRGCLETLTIDRWNQGLRFTAYGETHVALDENYIDRVLYLAANEALHRQGLEMFVREDFPKIFAKAKAPYVEQLRSLWRELSARRNH